MVLVNEPIVASVTPQLHKSLVVVGMPAHNEEKTIARVVLAAQRNAHIVIVCDDGSSDLTGMIAEQLGAVVIRHQANRGYGAALRSLFERARLLRADVFITLDADGQHDPSQIPLLVKPIEDGVAEVVLGSRFIDKNGTADMPLYRKIGIEVITKLINGLSKNCISDAQSGFRAYGRKALENLSVNENGMSASIELLGTLDKNNFRVSEVPISCTYHITAGDDKSAVEPIARGFGLLMFILRRIFKKTLGRSGIWT